VSTVEYDPFAPELREDPYPLYHRLRAQAPVHRSALGMWLISRYSDAELLLRDRRLGRNFSTFLDAQIGHGPLRTLFDGMMLYADPPDHTRLRNLVARAFTPTVVASMAGEIQRLVDRLLDARAAEGTIDVIEHLAYPLPVLVICQMLGIPTADRDWFQHWSRDLGAALDYVLTPEVVARGDGAAQDSTIYLRALIRERRHTRGDDLLSKLIEAEDQGSRLTEPEIISTCMLLFGAGHETTMGLIGNAMLAALQHPDQLRALRDDAAIMRTAVDEFLRFDTPVQMAGRIAREPIVLDDAAIAEGDVVVILLGAANRDPARFERPDELDVRRPDNAPLSFGGGVHYCLGAALARLEAQAALGTLIRRFPDLRLDAAAPEWRDTVVLRGLRSLPLRFSPTR
jgi:cytochrome P450